MKKLITSLLVLACAICATGATYQYREYTATNATITITGDIDKGLQPLVIMQDITGSTTNTATQTFNSSCVNESGAASTNLFTLTALTAVVGGSEVPLVLTPGSNAPLVIKKNDEWKITAVGTAGSNVVYKILYKID